MFKKFCGVVLCLVLIATSLFSVKIARAAEPYDVVRIKLSMGDITSTQFFVDGNYTILEAPSVALPRQIYTVKIEGASLSLYQKYNPQPEDTPLFTGEKLTLIANNFSEGYNNTITLKNAVHGYCNYLGNLHFTINSGYIWVINHIYMEDYLYGVVPYEMSDSWPIEALKAQAIAARNYAAIYAYIGDSYDMVDTPKNQTYHGYVPSYENAIKAVKDTVNQVMLSDGLPFEAYYSASNGGVTEIPQHVWSYSNPLKPFQVIKEDAFDVENPDSKDEVLSFPKVFSETKTVEYFSDVYMNREKSVDASEAQLYAANALRYLEVSSLPSVAAAGYIAQVTDDVQIVGVNSMTAHTLEGNHGGIGDYNGNDYSGTNNCKAYEKATVNMTVLANKYSEEEAYVKLGDINADDKISITDYTMLRLNILALIELNEQQKRAADVNKDGKISITDYTMMRLDILKLSPIVQEDPGPGKLVTEQVTVEFDINLHELDNADGQYKSFYSSRLSLFAVEESEDQSSWNIYQRRFGHGIGMSQRGAQQRALAGQTYTQILDFYYPNTTISPLNIVAPVLSSSDSAPNKGVTNAKIINNVNVRITPDTVNDPIWQMMAGARIEVTNGNPGSEWYDINFGGITAYIHKSYVELDILVESVTMEGSVELHPVDTFELSVVVLPEDAADKSLSWSSSNTDVATVSDLGVITAVGVGSAIVSATTYNNGRAAQCQVTVVAPIE